MVDYSQGGGTKRPRRRTKAAAGKGAGGDDDAHDRALFTAEANARSVQRLLDAVKARAAAAESLTGLRALVVRVVCGWYVRLQLGRSVHLYM